jgi:hypothetical protein
MAVPLVAVAAFSPNTLQSYVIFAAGGLAGIYGAMIGSPPEWMDRWRRGAEGERRTEKQLRVLGKQGWQLHHDIESRRGNFDHVAVGPNGVFVLETKDLTGRISISGGKVIAERSEHRLDRWSNDEIGKQARGLAFELHEHLLAVAQVRTWVTPVVVLWADFPAGIQEDHGVAYVQGGRVAEYLASHSGRVPSAIRERILAALKAYPVRASTDG